LVAFFSWGRGYQFYTAVVYPYERKDGKLWLLMGMSEGILKLDTAWGLEAEQEGEGLPPVPTAKRKPKVTISKWPRRATCRALSVQSVGPREPCRVYSGEDGVGHFHADQTITKGRFVEFPSTDRQKQIIA